MSSASLSTTCRKNIERAQQVLDACARLKLLVIQMDQEGDDLPTGAFVVGSTTFKAPDAEEALGVTAKLAADAIAGHSADWVMAIHGSEPFAAFCAAFLADPEQVEEQLRKMIEAAAKGDSPKMFGQMISVGVGPAATLDTDATRRLKDQEVPKWKM